MANKPGMRNRILLWLGVAVVAGGVGSVALTHHTGGPPSEVWHSGSVTVSADALPTVARHPKANLTPGAINPDVTQATIAQTICTSGWTATIRPPATYTTALKIQQIREYGYTDTNTQDYEEDHLIPLELGGAPRDPHNLWPEAYPSAHDKDQTENTLHRQVCAGTVTLNAARAQILSDWGPR